MDPDTVYVCLRISLGLKVVPDPYLFEFEDEDFYGSKSPTSLRMRISMGLKVLPHPHLFEFEDKDFYGSESSTRPTEIKLSESSVWVWKEFQTCRNPYPIPQTQMLAVF